MVNLRENINLKQEGGYHNSPSKIQFVLNYLGCIELGDQLMDVICTCNIDMNGVYQFSLGNTKETMK